MNDSLVPVEVYGTIFRMDPEGRESLDAGTLRYTVDGSRIAANELLAEMHPESRRRVIPVRIKKFLLVDPKEES